MDGQTDARRSTRTAVAAILLLLLLGWFLGLFSSNEAGLAHTDNGATVEDGAAMDEASD